MPNLIYIHGYKGENSSKFKILEENFDSDNYRLFKPVQDKFSPLKSIGNIESLLEELNYENIFLIGSSRGGLLAYYLMGKHDLPGILINPALEYSEENYLNYIEENNKEAAERYFNELNEIKNKALSYKHDPDKINLFISKNDELIDHSKTLELIGDFKGLLSTDDSHRFESFGEHIELIKEIISPDPDEESRSRFVL